MIPPGASPRLDELERLLAARAIVGRLDPRDSGLLLQAWDGEPIEPPLVFGVDEALLRERLAILEVDAVELFPKDAPSVAALRLLTVHLEEAIAQRRPGHARLRLDFGGVASIDEPRDPLGHSVADRRD